MRRQQAKVLFEALEGRTHFDGTISGAVHHDLNGDHLIDEGSTVPAVRVYLDENKNGRRDRGERTVVTDASGTYAFTNVEAGTHVVGFEAPPGYVGSNSVALVGKVLRFAGSVDLKVPTALFSYTGAPWGTAGQNAQHTGISPFRGGPLTQEPTEVTNVSTDPKAIPDTGAKFGTPLFTRFNTVLVPVFENQTFEVRAYSRFSGTPLWRFKSDYKPAPSVQLSNRTATAVFQPALGADGRVYVPGAGGRVWVLSAPDRGVADEKLERTGRQVIFYGVKNFQKDPKKFRQTVFINTPLTVGPNGDVYFGVETTGTNPEGVVSSLARVRQDGTGGRVAAAVVAGSAPAVSNDGQYVYVATQSDGRARLERFAAGGNMAKAGSVVLTDPATKQRVTLAAGNVGLPVVAPDGDVYVTTPARSKAVAEAGNGWLHRFPADLSKEKSTNAQVMGQTETPSIVPASMVPTYKGASSYLVVAARRVPEAEQAGDFTDAQRLSLFDPAKSLKRATSEFRVPAVNAGTEQDPQYTLGLVSTPVVVDPFGGAIYFVDAAERLQRWSVTDIKVVTGPLQLGQRFEQEGGSPMVIGPDGQLYAVVGGSLFAAF